MWRGIVANVALLPLAALSREGYRPGDSCFTQEWSVVWRGIVANVALLPLAALSREGYRPGDSCFTQEWSVVWRGIVANIALLPLAIVAGGLSPWRFLLYAGMVWRGTPHCCRHYRRRIRPIVAGGV